MPRGLPVWAGLLDVPVGGGPPSRLRRELRSARRLEARPGPATAHGHRSQAQQPFMGFGPPSNLVVEGSFALHQVPNWRVISVSHPHVVQFPQSDWAREQHKLHTTTRQRRSHTPQPFMGATATPNHLPRALQPHQTTAHGHRSQAQQPFMGFAPRSCRDHIRGGVVNPDRDNAPATRHPCMKRTTPPSTLPRSSLKPPAPLPTLPRSSLKPPAPPSVPPRPEPQPLAPLLMLPSTRLKPLPPPSTMYGRFLGIFRR